MERLTLTRKQLEENQIDHPEYLPPRVIREWDARLSAYEDTGLMPEDVVRLIAENARLRKALGREDDL